MINLLVSNHRENSNLFRNENATLKSKITSLKAEISQGELEQKKLESHKADLEYKMRASEYNVEILKNQLENNQTESSMLKKHNDKQKKYIQIQKSKLERLCVDLEHYKRNPNAAKKRAAEASQKRSSIQPANANMSLANITLDLNDSFIFKESPEKMLPMMETPKAKFAGKKLAPFMPVETKEEGC